jgi:carboxysome shell carbonic anhydrase
VKPLPRRLQPSWAREWDARTAVAAAPWSVASAPAAAPSGTAHPLADSAITLGLCRRAEEIDAAFAAIEPALRALAPAQFEENFPARGAAQLRAQLGLDIPPAALAAGWAAPLDMRGLYARCVIGTFCRLVERGFDRGLARYSEGESAEALIHRWGFHAIDITPCADGRLSGVVDYILRVPPAVVAYRKSFAGAMFDVADSVRHWEEVELRRWREARPNAADESTRFLKIGVYHFSSLDPHHEGCAAHGSDTAQAAGALLERLRQFEQAVRSTHDGACVAILLVGVDTDTDAIRVHVPDAAGHAAADRFVDNRDMFARTQDMPREAAKEAIREAVAACAGVSPDDAGTEGMRWFCGYLLKNNIGQMDAVRSWHGGAYAEAGHTEKLIVVGAAIDDVQARNVAFQAQMDTVEAGSGDLDIGIKILKGLKGPRGLAVPVLVHFGYDPRIPGAASAAQLRALRLRGAILSRHAHLADTGMLFVQAMVRASDGAPLVAVPTELQS